MPVSIFVSYSHQDAGLVKPVVGLLRATKDLVFQDLDGIRPGRKWRQQIEEALYAAHLVVLFWCSHSSRSTEVRQEYELALATGKDLLPVLLDTTPLPEQLSAFQWVDFRQFVGSGHRSYRRWVILAAAVVLMLMVWFLFYGTLPRAPLPPPPTSLPYPSTPLPPPPASAPPVFALVLLVATIVVLVTWIVWRAHRRRARPSPTDSQQQMAEKLQVEFFRRGIGSV